jgi:hypothetical protein
MPYASNNVSVECPLFTDTFPASEMVTGETCILVTARGCSVAQPGDPAVRGRDELVFPKTGTWSHAVNQFTVRRLRPGERVIIEAKKETS